MADSLKNRLEALAGEVVREMGLHLYHIDHRRGGATSVLRLFIERMERMDGGGVTLDDCADVSRRLGAVLDALDPTEDPLTGAYTLEVSSPGLDRPLFTENDYTRFAGRRARVTSFEPIDGQRNFNGTIRSCDAGILNLVVENDQELSIPFSKVASGRLELEI